MSPRVVTLKIRVEAGFRFEETELPGRKRCTYRLSVEFESHRLHLKTKRRRRLDEEIQEEVKSVDTGGRQVWSLELQ